MKPIKYGVVMLFSIGLAILTYFHKFERESLGSNINGLMKVFVGVEEERDFVEKRLHQVFSAVRDSAVILFSRGKVQHASNGDKEGNFFTGNSVVASWSHWLTAARSSQMLRAQM